MDKDTKAVVIAAASGLVAGLTANKVRKIAAPHMPAVAVAVLGAAVFALVHRVVTTSLSDAF
jgi:hypothetical protein